MGNRSHLPLALTLALFSSACFTFEEPDLPEAGAAAILEAAIHVSDSSRLHFTAILAPALTVDGLRRVVRNDTIQILGLRVPPIEVRRNGARVYDLRAQLGGEGTPLTLVAPSIEDVIARPPAIEWPSIRRVSADTILLTDEQDLLLAINITGRADPAPTQSGWSLDLVTQRGNFRLGGNGLPPSVIRVPSYFLPPAPNRRISAVLLYFQSGAYRPPPGDYVLTLDADVRVRWEIRLIPRLP